MGEPRQLLDCPDRSNLGRRLTLQPAGAFEALLDDDADDEETAGRPFAELDEDDEKALKEQIKSSKGVGNFRSMFLNIPGGKPDSVKIIPVGDISTKDEFERVKNLTRSDVLAMWRINGALAGILPENAGGYGDLDKITRNNYENEVVPVQQKFLQLNEVLHPSRRFSFELPSFMDKEK